MELTDKSEIKEMKEVKEVKEVKEKTFRNLINEILIDLVTYGSALVFYTLFFMGSLGYYYKIPNETYINSASGNLTLVMNILVKTFYKIGYQHPFVFGFMFYTLVFLTFIYPVIKVIIFFIKRREHNNKKEAQ